MLESILKVIHTLKRRRRIPCCAFVIHWYRLLTLGECPVHYHLTVTEFGASDKL